MNMFIQTFLILLSSPLQANSAPSHRQTIFTSDEDACATGVHIVGVRGTIEEPGFGRMGKLVAPLLDLIPDSDAYAIDYPAAGFIDHSPWVNFPTYKQSEQTGVNNLITHLMDYTESCPDTKIVLMGYSQGAQVVGDVLCGRQGVGPFPFQQSLDQKYTASVSAIVQFGDPTDRRAVNLPWHVGTGTQQGLFARFTIANCTYLGSNWQSYCDKGDPFCALGNKVKVHVGYMDEYNTTAVNYIVGKVCGAEPCSSEQSVGNHDL